MKLMMITAVAALAAAGPTEEELESAAHDAKIRANKERALKELSH